ncbi:hypothetical protein [Micromonospora sp. WMMD1219]|uniref:hypothetical protein n=1 Tax=Micromonospora sp. WMMD1219 TaxID=3404115 RepID=UPI003BF567AE
MKSFPVFDSRIETGAPPLFIAMSATYRRDSEHVNESWTSIVCSVGCAIGEGGDIIELQFSNEWGAGFGGPFVAAGP